MQTISGTHLDYILHIMLKTFTHKAFFALNYRSALKQKKKSHERQEYMYVIHVYMNTFFIIKQIKRQCTNFQNIHVQCMYAACFSHLKICPCTLIS